MDIDKRCFLNNKAYLGQSNIGLSWLFLMHTTIWIAHHLRCELSVQ